MTAAANERFELNGTWNLVSSGGMRTTAEVPGSVMEALTEAGYNGWVTIELKVDEKKGVLRSLRDALAYAKECEKKHKEK